MSPNPYLLEQLRVLLKLMWHIPGQQHTHDPPPHSLLFFLCEFTATQRPRRIRLQYPSERDLAILLNKSDSNTPTSTISLFYPRYDFLHYWIYPFDAAVHVFTRRQIYRVRRI